MDRLPTGIPVLDRELDGGLPAGSVVVLKADSASQSELFLNTFTHVRETLYLTTVRSPDAVADAIERSAVRTGDPTVESIDRETSLEETLERAATVPEAGTLIVDSVDPLEASPPERYRAFLRTLRATVADAGAIGVLHAFKGEPSANRTVSEQVADVVFDLRTAVTSTEIANRLAVPKFRGGAALEEPVKLTLTDTVAVDTSRDIA
ncbi:MAG: ATPase domain-containing protein [Halorubrum sp.]